MKKKTLLILSIFLSLQLNYVHSEETHPNQLWVAFTRGGDLWLKLNEEIRVTKNKKVTDPKWSFDGRFIAYLSGEHSHEIWVYSLEQKQSRLVYPNGDNFQWAPHKNQLAFKIYNVLNTVFVKPDNVDKFENVAFGVGSYSWLPEGNGFLVSSISQLLPIGWTSVELFWVPVDANTDRNKIKHFFTLPAPAESEKFFAVGTNAFKWSSDKKWISFIAYPTASLSADSNTLCVLSSDAKAFHQLDPILNYQNWFQWSPHTALLAYIEGEGRIIHQNKHLKLAEFPNYKSFSLTPGGFVDRNFTWENDEYIAVERSTERIWTNDQKNLPQPTLYRVNIRNKEQQQISSPPKDFGDFNPYFLTSHNKLTWIRSDLNQADVWISNQDGSDAKVFIKNIDLGLPIYDQRTWDSIIEWHEPFLYDNHS